MAAVLEGYGFEPARHDDDVWLRNCPFDAVTTMHPEVVCGMNLAVVDGLISGLRTKAIQARLAPGPERCCVVITRAEMTDDAEPKARWPRGPSGRI